MLAKLCEFQSQGCDVLALMIVIGMDRTHRREDCGSFLSRKRKDDVGHGCEAVLLYFGKREDTARETQQGLRLWDNDRSDKRRTSHR